MSKEYTGDARVESWSPKGINPGKTHASPVPSCVAAGRADAANAETVLQYARELKGLSQEGLAKKVGIAPARLRMIEAGKHEFTIFPDEASKLRKLFGTSADDLRRPLTDSNKASYIHGLPYKDGRDE